MDERARAAVAVRLASEVVRLGPRSSATTALLAQLVRECLPDESRLQYEEQPPDAAIAALVASVPQFFDTCARIIVSGETADATKEAMLAVIVLSRTPVSAASLLDAPSLPSAMVRLAESTTEQERRGALFALHGLATWTQTSTRLVREKKLMAMLVRHAADTSSSTASLAVEAFFRLSDHITCVPDLLATPGVVEALVKALANGDEQAQRKAMQTLHIFVRTSDDDDAVSALFKTPKSVTAIVTFVWARPSPVDHVKGLEVLHAMSNFAEENVVTLFQEPRLLDALLRTLTAEDPDACSIVAALGIIDDLARVPSLAIRWRAKWGSWMRFCASFQRAGKRYSC